MARLTLLEKQLLRYPPTEATWLCRAKVEWNMGDSCGVLNSGSQEKCWLCGEKKPRAAKLIWPVYLSACEKAGIEPGTPWRESEVAAKMPAPPRKTRRKRG